jgi:arsenite-transporting ATPase
MNEQYLQRLARGQEACLQKLTSVATGLEVSRVPYFDMEVAGVYPLRYMGQVAYKGDNEEKWRGLMTDPAQKFIIFGGKGGVGKTSSSAALAIQMADDGHSTVVVSSDPAHSLGDALQMDLDGRGLTRVPGITGTGKLYALEVDTEGAISEFKEVIDAFLHKAQQKGEGGATGEILSQLNLQDFADVLDNAPPGTDELVALSKVLSLVQGKNEEGIKFDRVIIDTAPTGHTLRMLSYPEFLDNFFDKLIRVRERFKGATSLLNMFSGKGGASKVEEDNDFEEERDRLRDFQFKMMMLEDLFRDEETSEFVVVTIPTMLAVAETASLVDQLREQKVPVRHAVVNKIISADTAPAYMNRMAKGQAEGLRQLAALATSSDVALTQVAYFDTEVRNIYGLRVMAAALFDQQH